jgi:hypothetical protein
MAGKVRRQQRSSSRGSLDEPVWLVRMGPSLQARWALRSCVPG